MPKQIGSTNIEDLDDLDQNELIDEIDDLMEEPDTDNEEEIICKPRYTKKPFITEKVKKNAFDTLLLMVLIIALGNKFVISSIFKLPFLIKFESNTWAPIGVISILVGLMFFILKNFVL
jgi:hypothetical protein